MLEAEYIACSHATWDTSSALFPSSENEETTVVYKQSQW